MRVTPGSDREEVQGAHHIHLVRTAGGKRLFFVIFDEFHSAPDRLRQ